jgi:hypothetical protein
LKLFLNITPTRGLWVHDLGLIIRLLSNRPIPTNLGGAAGSPWPKKAIPLVFNMWPCKLKLDEEKWKHAGLARKPGFGWTGEERMVKGPGRLSSANKERAHWVHSSTPIHVCCCCHCSLFVCSEGAH